MRRRLRRSHYGADLAERHVVITGASSGVGRATAVSVARNGGVIFALARRFELLDGLVADIRAAGGRAHALTCDVTNTESVHAAVGEILTRFDHVDYLVNNAGRSIRRSVYASTDRLHDYERIMAVNYFGAVRMTLALIPHWRTREFGHIVNVSTTGVQARNPYFSAYLSSKAALDAFADVAGTETLSENITFTSVRMPLVHTAMSAPSGRLNPMPAISLDEAAAMIIRALVDKPTRVGTRAGTISDIWSYVAPDSWRRKLHQLYLTYPESAAAQGMPQP